MQVIINHNNQQKKTLPCTAGKLVKVYGETVAAIHKDNILEVEFIDNNNGTVLSNPIVRVYDKGQVIFNGDAYSFISKLKK